MARLVLGSIVLFSALTLVLSCSSGIGRNPSRAATPAAVLNPNRPTGVDLGVTPTSPAAQPAAAGVAVPAIGSTPARDVMLLAFTTSSAANNADGSGNALSRDTVTDTNGVSDVFVAAISAQDIETRAFSQSLAGKFRFPRCTTCHSMQAADTLAFVSSPQPHAGPTPGPTFPNNTPSICARCHGSSEFILTPVELWQAPAASFDFRHKTVAQLATAASGTVGGDPSHFRDDPRVLWALDSGILPTFGGRNGVADDDHDGVLEPEDTDGTPRPVPGGAAVFLRQIEEWIASGRTVTTAAAIKDITLASRANGTTAASSGASTTPRVIWVPNGNFDPTNSTTARNTNPVGTLYVAFASTGSDIAGTDSNGVSDVFRAAVELRAEQGPDGAALEGGLNLVYLDGSTLLCSAINGGTIAGNGASTQPSIGHTTGDTVAFTSLATNLITAFTDANGTGAADVFVRKIGTQVTTLVSHSLSSLSTTGDGHSEQPSVDAGGSVVAFETDATNLLAGDTNALRDVYYANVSASSPFIKVRASVTSAGAQATGGASSAASVHVSGARVRVAFQSDATNLATGLVAATNVYLFDSSLGGGRSTLLNQKLTPNSAAIGDGSARSPSINADGGHVAFESDASNIDAQRATDLNHATDIFVVDTAQIANGVIAPFRLSVTTREGSDGNGASTAAAFGSFSSVSSSFPVGFVTYTTDATNLGTSDSSKLMVGFVAESALVANFSTNVTRGAAPLTVTFTDTSSGSPTAWAWDFDGDSVVDSTLPVPTPFLYTNPGTYTARLAVTKDGRQVASTATIVAVAAPTASFTVSATTGVTTTSFQFTDTSTQSPTAWQWDFDNNGSIDSTLQNPTKTYSATGTYSVRLVVTNESGSATTTRTDLIQVFQPVSASFTTSTTSGSAPLTVTFTNTSTGATTFAWDFGDGTSSTTPSPAKVFNSGGSFLVTLTATGLGGSSTSAPTTITVTSTASITISGTVNVGVSSTSAYASSSLTFTGTATGIGTLTGFAWDFDSVAAPGTLTASGSPANPAAFPEPAGTTRTYVVRLTVTGSTDSASVTRSLVIVKSTETVTLNASDDTSIYSNATGNSNGANPKLIAGTAYDIVTPAFIGFRRSLLRFDVSTIPANSTVSSAVVQLTLTGPGGTVGSVPTGNQLTGSRQIQFRRVTATWAEGSSNPAPGSPGNGALAASGDPTWASISSSFSSTLSGILTAGDTVQAYSTVSQTSQMEANVATWATTPATNFGWMLSGPEISAKTIKNFVARNPDPTISTAPKLNVTFTRPLP